MSPSEEFAKAYTEATKHSNQVKELWVAKLRHEGFVAAHPNDRWVNRETNEVVLAYPQFKNGRVKIGDKVMLGSASDPSTWRRIKVTGIRGNPIALCDEWYYKFEDLVEGV